MVGLNRGQFCWDSGLFCTVDMMDSGEVEGELPALLFAGVPEDTFTDHSRGFAE